MILSPIGTFGFEIDETADENLDEEIGMATQYWPSSMGMTFLVEGDADVIRGKLSFATYRGAGITDCAIPYSPECPENYQVPPELAHIMEFDKNALVLKLKSRVTPQEVRRIFERDTIPEVEYRALENISYRFADYCSVVLRSIEDYDESRQKTGHKYQRFIDSFDGLSMKILNFCDTVTFPVLVSYITESKRRPRIER